MGHIVPTHVGVYRHERARPNGREHCPHARGGVPTYSTSVKRRDKIVPTHVGVYRRGLLDCTRTHHCPHARGGVPAVTGWHDRRALIVPTHVGVYRLPDERGVSHGDCPRARGGVLNSFLARSSPARSFPRTRECSALHAHEAVSAIGCPSHAGVHRARPCSGARRAHFSRARRGVSATVRPDRCCAPGHAPRLAGASRSPAPFGCGDHSLITLSMIAHDLRLVYDHLASCARERSAAAGRGVGAARDDASGRVSPRPRRSMTGQSRHLSARREHQCSRRG